MDRIQKLQEFLQQNPNDCFLQHALALEYIKLNKDDEAKILFIKVLKYDDNYIGSYYHLAKLLERNNQIDDAILYYEKGMQIAKKLNDNHSYSELQSAYEDLVY